MFLPLGVRLDLGEHVVESLVGVVCRDVAEGADVAVFGEFRDLGLVVLVWELAATGAGAGVDYDGEVDVGVLAGAVVVWRLVSWDLGWGRLVWGNGRGVERVPVAGPWIDVEGEDDGHFFGGWGLQMLSKEVYMLQSPSRPICFPRSDKEDAEK